MTDSKRMNTIWRIVIFILLVTLVAFVSPLLGGSPSSFGLGFILWGTAPMLVALMMRLVTGDWSEAGFKPGFKKNARWYILIMIAYPVMLGFTVFLGNLISASTLSGFSLAPYLKIFLTAFPVFFIFAIFEEFGWRGYLVSKLASSGINDYLAYAIVAVVWATWHLPYLRELSWVYELEEMITFIPRFYLCMFAFGVLYNELRLITGSVWPAVFIHGLANSLGHPLAADFLNIAPGKEYLASFNGLFMIAFTGLLGFALNHWRNRKVSLVSLSKSGNCET